MKYYIHLDFQICYLFFIKTSLYKIFKLNYKIFLIDCIYKINIYQILLCIIINFISFNTIYYIKFAFLYIETIKL